MTFIFLLRNLLLVIIVIRLGHPSLVEVYQHYRGHSTSIIRAMMEQRGPLKCWETYTRLHCATIQKAAIFSLVLCLLTWLDPSHGVEATCKKYFFIKYDVLSKFFLTVVNKTLFEGNFSVERGGLCALMKLGAMQMVGSPKPDWHRQSRQTKCAPQL